MFTLMVAGILAAAPPQVRAEEELLSDLLPGGLSAFVQVVGSDRPVSDLTAGELKAVRDPAVYAAEFVAALQPECVVKAQPLAALVEAYGPRGSRTWLLAGPGLATADDVAIPIGESVDLGETLYHGYLLNAGETTLVVVDGGGTEIDLPPGGALAIMCSHSCSTNCDDPDRHACCWYHPETGCAFCQCIQDGKLPYPNTSCSSGGEGSTSCSMASAMNPSPKRVDTSDPTKR